MPTITFAQLTSQVFLSDCISIVTVFIHQHNHKLCNIDVCFTRILCSAFVRFMYMYNSAMPSVTLSQILSQSFHIYVYIASLNYEQNIKQIFVFVFS